MSYKSRLLIAIDTIVALSFLLSFLSGAVFLLPGGEGSQGGHTAEGQATLIGLPRDTWRDLHLWVSLVLVAAMAGHIVLHWGWIVRMARRMLQSLTPSGRAIRSDRAKFFFGLDTFIALAFLLSLATGLVFWTLGSGGYQGGRNPAFRTAALGVARGDWSDLHAWFSLMLGAGIVLHLALHWNWITATVKKAGKRRENRIDHSEPVPVRSTLE